MGNMRTYRFEASSTEAAAVDEDLAAAYLAAASVHGEPIQSFVKTKAQGVKAAVIHVKVAGDPEARAVARAIRSVTGDRSVAIDAIVGVGRDRRRVIL